MDNIYITVVFRLLLALICIVMPFIMIWLKSRLGIERMAKIEAELKLREDIVLLGVRFIEQVYGDLDGPDKYNSAVNWIVIELGKVGIIVTEEDLQGLIESTIRALKDEFGEEWGHVVHPENIEPIG